MKKIYLFYFFVFVLTLPSIAGSISTDFSTLPVGSILYGNAYHSAGMVYLTPNGNSCLGGLSFAEIDSGQKVSSFNAEFDFQIGGGSGADGISFSFASLGNVGAVGEWGTSTGISIEFDTYQNSGEINNNHMTLYYNGAARATNGSLPVNLNNNQIHHARVAMDNGFIQVFLRPSGGSESLIFSHTISGWSPYRGQFNFGGRTGGSTDIHRIDNFNATTIPITATLSGSSHSFGNVRVGTSATGSVTVTNTGISGSVLTGSIGAASGSEFSPTSGTKSFSLGQNQSDTRTYTYTPSSRGTDSTTINISSNVGNTTQTLTGTGVSPIFSSSIAAGSTIDLGEVGYIANQNIAIQNITTDTDLGNLTNMTILSANITGQDASYFTLENFTPGMILTKNQLENLMINFMHTYNGREDYGVVRTATLTLTTDVNTAFGTSGETYSFYLQATTIPEPTTLVFFTIIVFFLLYNKKRIL